MIDQRSSGIGTLHAALLAAEAAALWALLAVASEHLRGIAFTTLLPSGTYPVTISAATFLVTVTTRRLSEVMIGQGWTDAMHLAFRQTLAVTGGIFATVVTLKDPGISRVFLATFLPLLWIVLVFANRYQPPVLLRLIFGNTGRLPTLLVGRADLFPNLQQWINARGSLGLVPVGVMSYRGHAPSELGFPVVGDVADLKAVIEKTGARQLIVLNLPHCSEDAEQFARVCASCGCRLLIHNNLTYRLSYPLRGFTQDGYSFLGFQDEPLENPLNRGVKRVLDIAIALPVIAFILPVVSLAVWSMQRMQSPGPLFYVQRRSGRGGRTFRMFKFRTMRVCGDEVTQTIVGDPRIYAFGHLLRRTSVDELPQFLNVLVGDMSVVGPRPHFVQHDDLFASAVNEYRVRYLVKPGITGLAQSRGFRGEIDSADAISQRIQLDLLYIHSWTLWLDLAIVARTARQLLTPPPTAR